VAISASDIVTRFSVTSGSAGDSTAGTAAGSLGKYVSTTVLTDNTLSNLFDDVTGDENAASESEYRCVFVLNNHATLTLLNAVAWISAETAGGASVAIAVDNIAASAKGSASAQAAQIANEDTAPSGVGVFSSPTTKATGISLGNIGPGQVRAIWIRRTAANTAALDNDSAAWRCEGDTGA
jgi:hypothetical protein